jgi:hypothetical protein
MQVRTRDQLTAMYLKRMRLLHNNGKKRLRALHDQHRTVNEMLVDAFAAVVQHTGKTAELPDRAFYRSCAKNTAKRIVSLPV